MIELDVGATILTPTGWVNLEDEAGGYWLAADSFTESVTSHRKTEIDSEWMEGSFISRGVQAVVVEKVSVYVKGATPYQLAARLKRLTDGFNQLAFSMVVRFGDNQETWDCNLSDYTLSAKQEMRFATMVLVNASVPRQPTVVRAQVAP